MTQPRPLPLKAILLAVLALCVAVATGIGVVIVIPRYRARQAQRECKANLKGAYTAARAYLAEKDVVVADFRKIGFEPEPGNRYLYVADPEAGGFVRAAPKFGLISGDGLGVIGELAEIGVSGKCPDCFLTIACAGNLDTDDTLDVWSISTGPRLGPDGPIAAGELFNHVDDLTNHRVTQRIAFPVKR